MSSPDLFEDWPEPRASAIKALRSACELFAAARRELNEPLGDIDDVVADNITTLWMWVYRAGPENCTQIADNLYPLIQRPKHNAESPSYSMLLIDRAVSDVRDALDSLRAQPFPPPRLDLPFVEAQGNVQRLDQHAIAARESTALLQTEVSAFSGNKVEVNILSMRMGDLTLNLDLFEALRRSMMSVVDVLALDRVARSIANSSISILKASGAISILAVNYARRIAKSAQRFVDEVRVLGTAGHIDLEAVDFPQEVADYEDLPRTTTRLVYAEAFTLEKQWLKRVHSTGPQALAYLHASIHRDRANYIARRSTIRTPSGPENFAYAEDATRLYYSLISLLETSLRIPRGADLEYIAKDLDGRNLVESRYSLAQWICPLPGSAYISERHMVEGDEAEASLPKGAPVIPVRIGVKPSDSELGEEIARLRAVVLPLRRGVSYVSTESRLPSRDLSGS